MIRPGAANEDKKLRFARRYLGLEPPEYAHPVLRDVLGDTYGLLVYEEQILFVAHKFAGLDYGTADKLRRLLIKQKDADELEQMGTVFEQRAALIGRQPQEIHTVWHALRAFSGFMFNKAHGAAYAMEAARGLWLKQHWPIHFLAGVLNNRRGFYQPLVYVIEIIRAGGQLRLPDINASEQKFAACGRHVSIPLWQIKGLRQEFSAQWRKARQAGPFGSWEDFVQRVRPDPADAQLLAKSGALDVFFRNRHEAVWRAGQIARTPMKKREQEYSLWDQYSNVAKAKAAPSLPPCTDSIKAEWEASLLGFPVTVDPFQLWLPPASDPGCIAVVELENHIGREVEIRGIVVATRSHHTLQGKLMKFISLADPSGIAECTLFPDVYRRYGAICYGARWLQCRVQVERDATDSGIQLQVIAATQHTSMDPFLLSAV
ncbi:MAG: hypothetical protein LR015_07470 [Verrucomicrobia bacterium]|nr:hypothetical protein [Verrucomicrobiota bacterium]